ncbi:hypothetical protein DF139_33925 [Burkholderia stagnalis]|uniref:Uncharacterized protein n=2 Tax=Burkholderia stagnalis TaxID=1503054 RepID=A0ABX9YET5_9BURK|nr:hypothetical protein DF158_33900 [Burkholderia stagnalis]RQQ59042.1 hypothetical protein DF137_34275 [Burkholderia stagnalis]RQQ59583.1 hypothetical protein DF139_33925 [Burkholderia stagnalis]RQQ73876.1 hypothetical protein DF138_33625 [Burkholderia stagnalis]RQQ79662.1 hypothetical protein DF136_34190 [Burkholderia stagnalis]
MAFGRLTTRSFLRPGPADSDEEAPNVAPDVFKVRYGYKFIEEAASQMESLYLMLVASEAEQLGSASVKLAGRAVLQSTFSAAGTFAGAGLGTLTGTGPVGPLAGAAIGGAAGKRIYKNLEREAGKYFKLNIKINRTYPSVSQIDNELSSAYLQRVVSETNTAGPASSAILATGKMALKHTSKSAAKILKFLPLSKVADVIYQYIKAKSGLSPGKIDNLLRLMNELENTLKREKESIESSFHLLIPHPDRDDIGIEPGRAHRLDALFGYRSREEQIIRFKDISEKYGEALDFMNKNRKILYGMQLDR